MQIKNPHLVTLGGRGGIKSVEIGGNAPVSIQTMWKESITSVLDSRDALLSVCASLEMLESMGCDIVRFAVPDLVSAEALCLIAKNVSIPLVADIHFDYKLALACLKGDISKIRINPGNIGSLEKVRAVVEQCKDKNVPIRIGVNSGSLPKDIVEKIQQEKITRGEGLVETALREVEVFDSLNFSSVVVSMKASTIKETIEANEKFAEKYSIPLHIGVTEAGPLIGGIVKSTMAFTHLLKQGIGSTIRVSLSSAPENEVITAREILSELGLRDSGVKIISCPRCGRNGFDVHGFVDRWQSRLMSIKKNLTVAVMGCVVNGPGEGKHADIGITGMGDSVFIFRQGEIVRKISAKDADNAFSEELNKLCN
ncbi:MAG: flavodoxin-dependent (E)-4-hydroxy-3-methylbut-2-enyl-diphosphate synthase [Spirochaetaceae bacterium]|nr:flavodoxin-dependent (E)-4-hydroxy-3-methylbut-2-enyl-diphosphate synthase [Spirochaetaceae bacterium]